MAVQITFNIHGTDERPDASLLYADLQAVIARWRPCDPSQVRVVDVIVLPEEGYRAQRGEFDNPDQDGTFPSRALPEAWTRDGTAADRRRWRGARGSRRGLAETSE